MDYRDLVFYQKAQLVVMKINIEIKGWAKTTQAFEISRQLFRSAVSVGANIAEGHGRHEGLEYIHYLIIAQGSANETDHWLHTAVDCELGIIQMLHQLIALNNETRKMLNSAIGSLRKKKDTIHESPIPYSPSPSEAEKT